MATNYGILSWINTHHAEQILVEEFENFRNMADATRVHNRGFQAWRSAIITALVDGDATDTELLKLCATSCIHWNDFGSPSSRDEHVIFARTALAHLRKCCKRLIVEYNAK